MDRINSRPTIGNVAMAMANTEYSYDLPVGTSRFIIKLRNPGYVLKVCWVSEVSGTIYKNVMQGGSYEESDLREGSNVLYFQTTADDQVVEIISWV